MNAPDLPIIFEFPAPPGFMNSTLKTSIKTRFNPIKTHINNLEFFKNDPPFKIYETLILP